MLARHVVFAALAAVFAAAPAASARVYTLDECVEIALSENVTLAQAREDSLSAWTDGRIVKIFKKYKVRNEFSIDYFG